MPSLVMFGEVADIFSLILFVSSALTLTNMIICGRGFKKKCVCVCVCMCQHVDACVTKDVYYHPIVLQSEIHKCFPDTQPDIIHSPVLCVFH